MVYEYRSVPLVLVALLREYAYSADLPWLPKFSKKKKKKKFFFFFFFFFFLRFFSSSKRLFTKLLICFAKTLLFTLEINNVFLINLFLL